jgi:NAD-dependent deacetylase
MKGGKGMETEIELLADLIVQAKKIVVFTGAGISTESGIRDFRGPGGLWEEYDPEDFTIQKFLASPEARKKQWNLLTEFGLIMDAQPNPAHYAIADLDRLGKLTCVITQNVDNLHQKAGVPDEKVLELHGNMQRVVCLSCHRRFPIEEMLRRIDEGEEIPDCPDCHGILKPDAVFFGEQLPRRILLEAAASSQNCDLFIVIGSTLVVYPAAYMPEYAQKAGAELAVINLMPTDFDQYATVVIYGKAGEVMPEVIESIKSQLSLSKQIEDMFGSQQDRRFP